VWIVTPNGTLVNLDLACKITIERREYDGETSRADYTHCVRVFLPDSSRVAILGTLAECQAFADGLAELLDARSVRDVQTHRQAPNTAAHAEGND
jgi:hypothetical protein